MFDRLAFQSTNTAVQFDLISASQIIVRIETGMIKADFELIVSRLAALVDVLTFGRAIDDFVLLLSMFQDAFRAEHVSVLHAVKLDLLAGVGLAELDLTFAHLTRLQGRVSRRGHWQPSQHLIVYGEVVRAYLMRRFVVGTLDHAVLGQLARAL